MGVYTENIVENQARKEKVYDMMRKGDWQAVCKEFHVSHQIHLKKKTKIYEKTRQVAGSLHRIPCKSPITKIQNFQENKACGRLSA